MRKEDGKECGSLKVATTAKEFRGELLLEGEIEHAKQPSVVISAAA